MSMTKRQIAVCKYCGDKFVAQSKRVKHCYKYSCSYQAELDEDKRKSESAKKRYWKLKEMGKTGKTVKMRENEEKKPMREKNGSDTKGKSGSRDKRHKAQVVQ